MKIFRISYIECNILKRLNIISVKIKFLKLEKNKEFGIKSLAKCNSILFLLCFIFYVK